MCKDVRLLVLESVAMFHRNSYAPAPPQHSKSGTISPVGLPCCATSPVLYPRLYFSLRAQKTLLQSIERTINELPELEGDDEYSVNAFSQILSTLLNANYSNIFQYSIGAVAEIKSCLAMNLSKDIDRIGYSLLRTSLGISQLITRLSYDVELSIAREDQMQIAALKSKSPTKAPPKARAARSSLPSESEIAKEGTENDDDEEERKEQLIRDADEQSYIVCRICEKPVPLRLIEAHSKNCALAYESSKTVVSIDDRMRKLQALAKQTILRNRWPGSENKAVNTILPVLHAVILLDRAISCDVKNDSGSDELDIISESLMPIALAMLNSDAADILKKASFLVTEKLHATTKLSQAMNVLHRTSILSGLDIGVSVGQTTIADFTFIKKVSSGAYARVFLAKKNKTGDIYAVKVLPKTGLRQKNEVRRVLIEKDILLKVYSPYMIKFFYSIIGEHNLYLVMEYLPGGDLFSVLQKFGSIDEDSAKIYTAQIVAALEFLRKSAIIHRDLKPDNILVDASGRLKLTDFGLSFFGMVDRSISSNQKQIFDNEFVGTPDYTSPEMVLSQPHTYTADYWALGTMLYEFLAGIPPFHGETPSETFQNIIKGHYDEEDLEDFSEEAKDIIRKLLEQDPTKRLGANSIDEIKQHPWFAGINWEKLTDLPPPFVPDLTNKLDTSLFEDRYAFENRDEEDIIEDIKAVETHTVSARDDCHRTSILSMLDEPFDDEDEEDEMDSFSSVAVHQLQDATNEDARQMRKMSGVLSEDIVASLEDASDIPMTPPKKRSRRRIPRNSLSPKLASPGARSPSRLCSPGRDLDDSDESRFD